MGHGRRVWCTQITGLRRWVSALSTARMRSRFLTSDPVLVLKLFFFHPGSHVVTAAALRVAFSRALGGSSAHYGRGRRGGALPLMVYWLSVRISTGSSMLRVSSRARRAACGVCERCWRQDECRQRPGRRFRACGPTPSSARWLVCSSPASGSLTFLCAGACACTHSRRRGHRPCRVSHRPIAASSHAVRATPRPRLTLGRWGPSTRRCRRVRGASRC